jgi:hypothetical protein
MSVSHSVSINVIVASTLKSNLSNDSFECDFTLNCTCCRFLIYILVDNKFIKNK